MILFLDEKNFYNGARRAFFTDSDSHYCGSVNPVELAELICNRCPLDVPRQVHQVRVYVGRPDSYRQPKTYAAHIKQCNAWDQAGAIVVYHPLRYPEDWPDSKAQQKGIDVALAVDFVTMATDGEYDVGVVASTDTDLKPAVEYVYYKCGHNCRVEIAAWFSSSNKGILTILNARIWYHKLKRDDYDSVADLTDYNI